MSPDCWREAAHRLNLSTTLRNGTTITHHYNSVGQLESITSDWVDTQQPATLASGLIYAVATAPLSSGEH